MPMYLNAADATFEQDFTRLLSMKREDSPDVDAVVAGIIEDVRGRGDAAVIELTSKFDRLELTPEQSARIDELCLRSAIPQTRAAGLLLKLEFSGVVRSFPGKIYALG